MPIRDANQIFEDEEAWSGFIRDLQLEDERETPAREEIHSPPEGSNPEGKLTHMPYIYPHANVRHMQTSRWQAIQYTRRPRALHLKTNLEPYQMYPHHLNAIGSTYIPSKTPVMDMGIYRRSLPCL